jgi:hypothetical protein
VGEIEARDREERKEEKKNKRNGGTHVLEGGIEGLQ